MKIAPQLATLVASPPKGVGWVHEIKYDGYRMLCHRAGEIVRIFSRNGNDWTARMPALAAAALGLKAKAFLLDGEAVVLDPKGASSFARMQDAMSRGDDARLVYFAFDLLELAGEDLRALPLVKRKARLLRLLRSTPGRIRYSEHFEGDGAAFLSHACKMGLEGIVSKQGSQPYRAGRGGSWQKSKCLLRQEFIIVGYWERSDIKKDFGSLALGAYEKGKLVYVGNVGTGWTALARKEIRAKLMNLSAKEPPLDLPRGVSGVGLHWVKPRLVGEVAFSEWTNDGMLRHPSFQGLREDKRAAEVVIERPVGEPGLKVFSHWDRTKSKNRGSLIVAEALPPDIESLKAFNPIVPKTIGRPPSKRYGKPNKKRKIFPRH